MPTLSTILIEVIFCLLIWLIVVVRKRIKEKRREKELSGEEEVPVSHQTKIVCYSMAAVAIVAQCALFFFYVPSQSAQNVPMLFYMSDSQTFGIAAVNVVLLLVLTIPALRIILKEKHPKGPGVYFT